VWSLARGDDVLEGGRAAGAILLPHERRTAVLLAAAAPVHLAISIGWAAVMATALPHGREPTWGVVGGMVIATLDLALIGRRIPLHPDAAARPTLGGPRGIRPQRRTGSTGATVPAPARTSAARARNSVQSKRRLRARRSPPLSSATDD
jgi:hypothetical protein